MSEEIPERLLWAKLSSNLAFQKLLVRLSTDIEKEKTRFFDMEGEASEREKETQRLKVKHYRELLASIKRIVTNSQTGRKT